MVAARRRARAGVALAALISTGSAAPASADDATPAMRGLDEQVQEVKSEVLSIATELDRLEERLLYPSNTQVAVFVSLGEGDAFRLDSMQIEIDGASVARHVYAFQELEAMKKGGVQRIYTGNVATGEHRIDVSVAGKSASGTDFSARQSFAFSKEAPPKMLEITLAGGGSGGASIRLGDD